MLTHSRFIRYSTPDVIGEATDSATGDGELAFDGSIPLSTNQETRRLVSWRS